MKANRNMRADEFYDYARDHGFEVKLICGKWILNGREYALSGGKGSLFGRLRLVSNWICEERNQKAFVNYMTTMEADTYGEWPELEILKDARERLKIGLEPLAYPLNEKELKIIHYLIDGKPNQTYAIFFLGLGNSGKTTICNIIRQLFGRENVCNCHFNEIGSSFKRNELMGKRLWCDDDISRNWTESQTGTFKKIVTHAVDQFEAKFQAPVESEYRCKCLFCGNVVPNFDYADTGTMRRIIYYRKDSFTQPILNCDEDLSTKTWSREDLVNFAAHALNTPIDDLYETFKEETRQLIMENNTVGKFILTKQPATYDNFQNYCDNNGYRAVYNKDNFDKIVSLFTTWENEKDYESYKNAQQFQF